MAIHAVPLEKAYRLLNLGATTLISAEHDGVENVMPASWVCAVEFQPAKVSVVLDKSTYTRQLIEQSGEFVIQIPVVAQATLIMQLAQSHYQLSDKMALVNTFYQDESKIPYIDGCVAWLKCKLIPEPHHQQTHDLFIAEIVGAWADDRVFKDGHWQFEHAADELRTLHYVAGGQFYAIGQSIQIQR
ncbi:MAG: flavin reductase family protein [Acinetobacter sp.]|nr:flavin reductase family protein [Acinetobacter sp.]